MSRRGASRRRRRRRNRRRAFRLVLEAADAARVTSIAARLTYKLDDGFYLDQPDAMLHLNVESPNPDAGAWLCERLREELALHDAHLAAVHLTVTRTLVRDTSLAATSVDLGALAP